MKATSIALLLVILLFGVLGALYYSRPQAEPDPPAAPVDAKPLTPGVSADAESSGQAVPTQHATPHIQDDDADRAAEEARALLAKAQQRADAENKARLDQLQAQLERESALREQAETAAAELAKRMHQLQQTLQHNLAVRQELQQRLEQLQQAPQAEPDPAVEALVQQIESEQATLQALSMQEQEVQQQVIAARQRQWELEDEIIASGGTVDKPLPRVWSPNYRPLR